MHTPPGQLASPASTGAFVVTTDSADNAFTGAYNLIGLTKDVQWFEIDGEYTDADGVPIDGHAAAVHAPALANSRAQACCRNQP